MMLLTLIDACCPVLALCLFCMCSLQGYVSCIYEQLKHVATAGHYPAYAAGSLRDRKAKRTDLLEAGTGQIEKYSLSSTQVFVKIGGKLAVVGRRLPLQFTDN